MTGAGQKCPKPRTAININKPATITRLAVTAAAVSYIQGSPLFHQFFISVISFKIGVQDLSWTSITTNYTYAATDDEQLPPRYSRKK